MLYILLGRFTTCTDNNQCMDNPMVNLDLLHPTTNVRRRIRCPTRPTVIHINNDDDGTPCQFCGGKTPNVTRKSVGGVAIAWGCCLLWTTGFLCWLPCVMDGCKDVELVCVKCQNVKNTIPANCC